MHRFTLFSSAILVLLGGCVLVGTYEYDGYEDAETTAGIAASSSSTGSGGAGGSAGMGGGGGQGGGGQGGGLAPCAPGVDAGTTTPELCNNEIDDDCMGDGDCTVNAAWADRFGDEQDQKLRAAHSNSTGDIAISGEYRGILSVGGVTVSQGTMAFQPYAVRLDSDGKAIFGHDIDRAGTANGVVLRDTALVMVGEYESNDDATKKNIFIRKVDPSGKFIQPDGWHIDFGLHGANRGAAVATTSAANAPVFITAAVSGANTPSTLVGCPNFMGNDGSTVDAVILALNSQSGDCMWAVQIVNATPTTIVTNTTTVTVAGVFKGKINPGPWFEAPETVGGNALGSFIAAYDASTGTQKWYKTFIATEPDQQVSFGQATVDASGNVAIAGTLMGKLTIGGIKYTSSEEATSVDALVAKFNTTGNVLWSDRFGGAGAQLPMAIAELNGRLIVGGKTAAAMAIQNNMDSGPLCVDSHCMFLLSLDQTTGKPAWGRAFGGTEPIAMSDTRVKVATGMGNLWIASSWSTPVDFGQGPIEPPGVTTNQDVFLAKFSSVP
jgi:hypothetical protein